MARTNKIIRIHEDNNLLAGILAHLGKSGVPMDGHDVKAKDIVPKIEARIAAASKSAKKKAEWLAAVAEEQAVVDQTDAFIALVREALRLHFRSHPDILADFGLKLRKETRKLTTDEAQQKLQRTRATREARHTMGSRERTKVRGGDPATPAASAPVTTTPAAASQPAVMPPLVNGARS